MTEFLGREQAVADGRGDGTRVVELKDSRNVAHRALSQSQTHHESLSIAQLNF